MTKEVICPVCEGHGFSSVIGECSISSHTCDHCNGSGLIEVPMTKADRIRAMSDEELAKLLSHPCECSVDPETDGYRECGNNLCIAYLLKWLKQPAEVEHG